MRHLWIVPLTLAASPALAAERPFVSLRNTDFVVTLGFLVFVGILIYYRVPGMIGGLLDKRAETIRDELAQSRALRDEAQKLLASYEKKSREVAAQADRIVTEARDEAQRAAAQAKDDIRTTVARRLASAQDKIASAEQAAVRQVRDSAVTLAVGLAQDILAADMSAARANALIEDSIAQVAAKMH